MTATSRLRSATRATLLAATLAGGLAAPALAGPKIDEATQARIRTELGQQGYDVRRIGMEDGMIEVYAIKDGKKLELYLDQDLKIVKSKG